ncbi:MAG TPA: glycosyltransferase [Flavisolibacter sp.]|nr:glycosyltransferase [Flavisolibacter sp.]
MNPAFHKTDYLHIEQDRHGPIRGRDIVIIGLQPWYFPTGCNAKNMAQELALHNRVLYVNFQLKRKAYLSKNPDSKIEDHVNILKEGRPRLREISNNLWEYYPKTLVESVNWLPTTGSLRVVNYLNNRRFAKDIREAAAELGFSDIILLNDNDIYNGFYLKQLLRPSLYIYYMRDFLQGYTYWKKHTSVLEPELIKKSDLVVANSQYYAEYSQSINPRSYYIGQGCSFEHFDHTKKFAVPEDISRTNGPLIGYIGALDSARLDLRIIEAIARAEPSWKVVMVGPEDEVFRQSSLHQLENVLFLGGKPFAQLPAYVQHFDVCINPQLSNEITRGNYPLKIDEYLAMGKPVVATRTGAMKIFESQTYLANEPSDYPALIRKALLENSPGLERERIAFAQSHTWENCIAELYKAISVVSKQKINS